MGCTATTAQQEQQQLLSNAKQLLTDQAVAPAAKQVSKRSMVATSDDIPRPTNEECKRKWAETIVVAGAEALQSECMGEFSLTDIASGSFQNWKPIYKNQHGKFLFFCADLKLWLVGTSYTKSKGRLSSSHNPEAPEASEYWKVWNGEKWSSHFKVSATAKKIHSTSVGDFVPKPAAVIEEGDWVCVRGTDKRGRVLSIADNGKATIRWEGRAGVVTPFCLEGLHPLPESFSRCVSLRDEDREDSGFSLPQCRM